jgi:hypothetical protein
MAETQEAWSRRKIVAALCMDIEAAFLSVAQECRAKKMRAI